jgi:hypothetical protein
MYGLLLELLDREGSWGVGELGSLGVFIRLSHV